MTREYTNYTNYSNICNRIAYWLVNNNKKFNVRQVYGYDRLGVGGLENKRRIADWNWRRSVWCKRREGANYIRDECAGTGPGAVRYPGLE